MIGVIRVAGPDLRALAFVWAVAVAVTWQTTIGDRALLPTDLYLRMQPWRAHAQEFAPTEGVSNPILDAVQQFYPWRLYASREVRQGNVPLWNPLMLSGTPFVGNNQSAVFYPETWLHYLIEPLKALGWATLLFLVIAGTGMYAFLRTIGLRPVASAIGAVSFMLSGFFVGWLTFPSFRSVPAWMPVMLLGFERAVRCRQARWHGLSAFAIGMQFLAGNLHISVYVLLAYALYVVARLAGLALDGKRIRPLLGSAALAVGSVVLGTLLAAAQLAPTLEFVRENARAAGTSYEVQLGFALAPPQLLLGIMPDIFGNSARGNHWGADLNAWWGRQYRTYTETAWYFGVAPLMLGIAGLIVARRRQSWFWLGMLLLGLGLAFGTPLNRLLYELVPGYSQLNGIGRAVVLACTAGSVLGALGCDALMGLAGDERRAGRALLLAAGPLLAVGLIAGLNVWVFTGQLEAAGMPGDLGGYTLLQIGRFAAILIAAWALATWGVRADSVRPWYALALLVALEMGVFMQTFTPEGRTEYLRIHPELVRRIEAGPQPARMASIGPDFLNRIAPNTHMVLGLQSAQGSDSLVSAPYARLSARAQSQRYGFDQVDPQAPLLDLMAVDWLASTERMDEPGWRLEALAEQRLYANEQAAPRAFVPSAVEPMADERAIFDAVSAPDADPLVARIVGAESERWEAEARPELSVAEYEANSVLVRGEMPAGAWVVLADVAYPGWRAYADGRERPIIVTDLIRRAVFLEQPASELRFVYLPASFRIGSFGSLLALGALAAVIGSVLAGRRRG